MPSYDRMHLVIAPPREIWADFRANSPKILMVFCAIIIWTIASSLIFSFLEHATFLHSAYFTVINVTTVGFGDVTPGTHIGKILAGINSVIGLVLFGAVVAALMMAIQPKPPDERTGIFRSGEIILPHPYPIFLNPEERHSGVLITIRDKRERKPGEPFFIDIILVDEQEN